MLDTFTSTGAKFAYHQEAMRGLREGKPQAITCHLMLTDRCQHQCAYCSTATREGDHLDFDAITGFVDILLRHGLKGAIVSGGGNPILYKCKKTGKTFNDVVNFLHERGLQIGLITNGMKLCPYDMTPDDRVPTIRKSWATVHPTTLDKCTWIRISMSGLDHPEEEVFVPDIDHNKTTLGMSYVFYDEYKTEADKNHGAVSTQNDLVALGVNMVNPTRAAIRRIDKLTGQFIHYVKEYHPRYLRTLPNCLEPGRIEERCWILQVMSDKVNAAVGRDICFVQKKPPQAPKHCWLGFVHPVLGTNGMVWPCDSVTLASAEVSYRHGTAEHKFSNQWAICHWSEVEKLYTEKPRSLIKNPGEICKGCVFHVQNGILEGVVNGTANMESPANEPEHSAFI